MYKDGSIISAVCHGGAIFPNVHSALTGESIIHGKKVTGFTTKGEEEQGVLDTIKSWNRPTIEKSAADAGAICEFASVQRQRRNANFVQMSHHQVHGMSSRRRMGE